MQNAAELIQAVFDAADNRREQYQQREMISQMLKIIKTSTNVDTDHQAVIRELALEMTDLVEPE
jgi:hypothetical protein